MIHWGGSHRVALLTALLTLAGPGCAWRDTPSNPAVMDSLAEMEIRIRLLQSELTDMRQAMAAREARQETRPPPEEALEGRLDELQRHISALPERFAELCPEPPQAATVTTQCESSPEVQRVVVSGDKLVVGQVERVWIEPPGSSLVAHIDPATEQSLVHTADLTEFERDGNKWVRFEVTVGEEAVSVERPVKRTTRYRDERRPVVEMRIQLGDVRESVEFTLAELAENERPMVLGRNFLTDVALVDVARKYVQPAFQAPSG